MEREMDGEPVVVVTTTDLVAVPPRAHYHQNIIMGGERQEREMLGPVVKTEWREVVGLPYYQAALTIRRERLDTDINIVELAPLEDLPYGWPSDYTRVCVKVDAATMTVYGGDPNYPFPRCG